MQRYLVALGSNRPHHRAGRPQAVLAAAVRALEAAGLAVVAVAPTLQSRPLGPSQRTYANAAALIETAAEPPEVLATLHRIEAEFGRTRRGRRWGSRVLDLDLVLWSGGCRSDPGLTIPHPQFRERSFVLQPARAIAGPWRDPLTGLTLRQLHARLTRPRPLPKPRQR